MKLFNAGLVLGVDPRHKGVMCLPSARTCVKGGHLRLMSGLTGRQSLLGSCYPSCGLGLLGNQSRPREILLLGYLLLISQLCEEATPLSQDPSSCVSIS
jgi:hypothetical protein